MQVRIRCDPGAVTPSFSSPVSGTSCQERAILAMIARTGNPKKVWGGRSQVRTIAPSGWIKDNWSSGGTNPVATFVETSSIPFRASFDSETEPSDGVFITTTDTIHGSAHANKPSSAVWRAASRKGHLASRISHISITYRSCRTFFSS